MPASSAASLRVRRAGPFRRPPAAAAVPAAVVLAAVLALPAAPSAQPFARIDVGPLVENPEKSLSAAWADYDGDGDADLLATHIGAAKLYRNDGADLFTWVPGPPSDTTADLANTTPVWADFDNDGDLDVYRCVFTRDSLATATGPLPNRLYRNDGAGAFAEIPTSDDSTFCPAACWVDFDRDGDVDLFAAGAIGSPDLFYRNDAGTLVKETALPFLGTFPGGVLPGWTDYDGDGDPDLVMVNHGAANEVWRNLLVETGVAGAFEPDSAAGLSDEGAIIDFGLSWGDYDNDGDLDAFLSTTTVDHLYRNDGAGTFARVLGIPPVQIARASSCGSWGDYDNDGDVDLFVPHAAATAQVPDLWRNDGGGTFTPALAGDVGAILETLPGPQAAEWCDYDRDGDLDLFVLDWLPNQPGGAPRRDRLYRNDAAGSHWLHVDLEGTLSNRSAIGAIVRVKATIGGQPTWQMREVSGGPTAFEFQRELMTHFGLGDAVSADSLVIEWPSGTVESLTSVAADQVLHVTEALPTDTPVTPPSAAATGGLRFVRPNPFRDGVSIGYALPRASRLEVAVYDGGGRLVRRLLDGAKPAGEGAVAWDGRDEAQRPVGPGIYFVRVATPDGEWSGKALRLR